MSFRGCGVLPENMLALALRFAVELTSWGLMWSCSQVLPWSIVYGVWRRFLRGLCWLAPRLLSPSSRFLSWLLLFREFCRFLWAKELDLSCNFWMFCLMKLIFGLGFDVQLWDVTESPAILREEPLTFSKADNLLTWPKCFELASLRDSSM